MAKARMSFAVTGSSTSFGEGSLSTNANPSRTLRICAPLNQRPLLTSYSVEDFAVPGKRWGLRLKQSTRLGGRYCESFCQRAKTL